MSVKGGGQGDQPPNPPPLPPKNTDSTPLSNQPENNKDNSQQDSAEQNEENDLLLPNGEPNFPIAELARLDEMINRQRWVVPVLPKGELEVLLEASIKLCKAGELFVTKMYIEQKESENILIVKVKIIY